MRFTTSSCGTCSKPDRRFGSPSDIFPTRHGISACLVFLYAQESRQPVAACRPMSFLVACLTFWLCLTSAQPAGLVLDLSPEPAKFRQCGGHHAQQVDYRGRSFRNFLFPAAVECTSAGSRPPEIGRCAACGRHACRCNPSSGPGNVDGVFLSPATVPGEHHTDWDLH